MNNFIIPTSTEMPTSTSASPTSSIEPKSDNSSNSNSNNSVIIGATLGGILGIIVLGLMSFVTFKWYKKAHRASFLFYHHIDHL